MASLSVASGALPQRLKNRAREWPKSALARGAFGAILVSALASPGAASCSDPNAREGTFVPAFVDGGVRLTGRRVVLVTIDGARWQDIFEDWTSTATSAPVSPNYAGPIPRTRALVMARGLAIGAERSGCETMWTAGGSNMSLPGYIEIFTGRRSRCVDNDCDRVALSVWDEAARTSVAGVASVGSWQKLALAVTNGETAVSLDVGPNALTTPREGVPPVVSSDAAPVHPLARPDYRPDVDTAHAALEFYRTHQPALFHVGFGDTDEWGHRDDYPGYRAALSYVDEQIGQLAGILDDMGSSGGATTVLITADHGRSSRFVDHSMLRPESGRTFLLAFGGGVPHAGLVCPTRNITLADIAPTIRALLGLAPDVSATAGSPIELVVPPNAEAQ